MLVYLSPVPWDSPKQRPHHFVDWYSHRFPRERIIWLNPYLTRLPKPRDLAFLDANSGKSPRRTPDNVRVLRVPEILFEPFRLVRWMSATRWAGLLKTMRTEVRGPNSVRNLVIGKPSHLAHVLMNRESWDEITYDAMDDFPEFSSGLSRRYQKTKELQIVRSVDNLWTSSFTLQSKFHALGVSGLVVQNGVSLGQLAPRSAFEGNSRPSTLRRIGYIGTIAEWFDFDFLRAIANEFPSCEFEIYGPIFCDIPSLPGNVKFLGEIPYEQVQERMETFDIGLIPFLVNRLTDSVDPVKYYEYLAARVPIISTSFGSMRDHSLVDPGVLLLDSVTRERIEDWLSKQSLYEKSREALLGRYSWKARFDEAWRWHSD